MNDIFAYPILSENLIVLFLFVALIIGGILRIINKKYGIAYTPSVFFVGIILGLLYKKLGYFDFAIETIIKINPHGLLQIFLPILVFDAGFNIDWHVFKKELNQILILAFPCVLVNALFMMLCVKFVAFYGNQYYTWTGAYMWGSLISCNDLVAIVALFKELGVSKKVGMLIEGESLLNDATGMILYQLGYSVFIGQDVNPFKILYMVISLCFGGVLLGIIIGIVATYLIKKMFNDEILVINVLFIFGFIAFFIAETVLQRQGILVSGIMTLVSYGCFMSAFGKTRISTEVVDSVHAFWKYLVYAAESIIFFLAGIIIGASVKYL